MPLDMISIETFMQHYGKALVTGDASEISACFAIPALVLHDGGANAVRNRNEMVAAFRGIAEGYRRQGLSQMLATVNRAAVISAELTEIDVTWAGIRVDGSATGHREQYRYLLRDTGNGPMIQVVINLPS